MGVSYEKSQMDSVDPDPGTHAKTTCPIFFFFFFFF